MKIRYQIVIGVFLLSALGGIVHSIHHHAYESGKADTEQVWQLKWAKRDGQDLLEYAARQQYEREEEQRRQGAINQVTVDAQTQIDKARLDAADAQSAADRLQLTLANIRRQLAASETGKLSAIASASTTKGGTGILLADVLNESLQRNQQLAAEADRRRVAGLACERAYHTVKGSQ